MRGQLHEIFYPGAGQPVFSVRLREFASVQLSDTISDSSGLAFGIGAGQTRTSGRDPLRRSIRRLSQRAGRWLVKEGDSVKKGQTLAIIDSEPLLQSQLQKAEAEVMRARAATDQIAAEPKSGDVRQEEAEIQRISRERNLGLASQDVAIQRAGTSEETAKKKWQRYQNSFNDGAVSRSVYDQKELEYQLRRRVREQLEQARSHRVAARLRRKGFSKPFRLRPRAYINPRKRRWLPWLGLRELQVECYQKTVLQLPDEQVPLQLAAEVLHLPEEQVPLQLAEVLHLPEEQVPLQLPAANGGQKSRLSSPFWASRARRVRS